ncbi:flagellar basal-body rod protein FlgF [Salinarimonas rosea]|uniref:flagellar basal-body rod protein FlgF n=1 Tax=Salinarimonas rosea TaxID=552063 RepID=UPI000400D722|nr:flagellar basal-body rod protein FlgF [Salinarimonas rosea]
MQPSIYVALSGQVALERRMETIARNVANMSTVGYRADEITFEQLLSTAGKDPVAFASAGETFVSRNAGGLQQTGNLLDFAVDGDAFFAFEGPNGPVYTRDGRFSMNANGELVTTAGYRVLDAGFAPIQLDADGGPPSAARDGMLEQGGVQVGALGLFAIPEAARLGRFENSGVVPDLPAEPVLDFVGNGVAQGFVEGANVNPVLEMTRLVMVSRAFDAVSKTIEQSERTQSSAIRTLGGEGGA